MILYNFNINIFFFNIVIFSFVYIFKYLFNLCFGVGILLLRKWDDFMIGDDFEIGYNVGEFIKRE